jgi:hypothetical protein
MAKFTKFANLRTSGKRPGTACNAEDWGRERVMQSRDGTGLAHDKAAKRSGNFKERRLKLWPVYPIMVFMDPSTIVQHR